MSGGFGLVSLFAWQSSGFVQRRSSFTQNSGWTLSFRYAAHFRGMQGSYPGRCAGQQLYGFEKIVVKLHVNRGHASAQQPKRELADSEREICIF